MSINELKQSCLNHEVTGCDVHFDVMIAVTTSLRFNQTPNHANSIQFEQIRISTQKCLCNLNYLYKVVEKPTSANSVKDTSSPSDNIYYALIATVIILIVVLVTIVVFLWTKMQRSVKLHAQLCFIFFYLSVP